jgi:hypothetical protein
MAEKEKVQSHIVNTNHPFRRIDPEPLPDPLELYTPMERAFLEAQLDEAARRKAGQKAD